MLFLVMKKRKRFSAQFALSALPETRILGCDMGGGSLELMAGHDMDLNTHAVFRWGQADLHLNWR